MNGRPLSKHPRSRQSRLQFERQRTIDGEMLRQLVNDCKRHIVSFVEFPNDRVNEHIFMYASRSAFAAMGAISPDETPKRLEFFFGTTASTTQHSAQTTHFKNRVSSSCSSSSSVCIGPEKPFGTDSFRSLFSSNFGK